MTDDGLFQRSGAERRPPGWALRWGPGLCAVVFAVMLVATVPLSAAKSQRLAWLEANLFATEGVVVDEIFTPGEGYREVVEVPRGPDGAPLRVVAEEATEAPYLQYRRGRTSPVLHWPADPSIAPQIGYVPRRPAPLWLDLVCRGLALFFVGLTGAELRRRGVLAREGLRLRGTVQGFRERRLANGKSYLHPLVRIEEPPHEGRVFESPEATGPGRCPAGSVHWVLAHPRRELFRLDTPDQGRTMLWAMLAVAAGLFFLPDLLAPLGP